MKSRLPKVLHPCGEVPLIVRVVELAKKRRYAPIVVVVDPEGARVREVLRAHFPDTELVFAVQEKQLGTGDATRAGLEAIPKHRGRVVTLYGDVPLLRASTLNALERSAKSHTLALLTAEVGEPSGYGRIVRDGRQVTRVVEHRDATPAQLAIREINVGVYCAEAALFREALGQVRSGNKQNEFYLTDVVELAAAKGSTRAVVVEDPDEVRGINTRQDLGDAEAVLRRWLIQSHQQAGVSFRDPSSVLIGEGVKIASDVVIGAGVQLYGRVKIGIGARIEGPTVIKNAEIGPECAVESFSHIEESVLRRGVTVGPYARVRPGSELKEGSRVGNFVELKKTTLGAGSKANHLSYLGDCTIGPEVNIGAGTITCNYDGVNKHRTEIGKGAFVGSNSTLVAPLTLSGRSYVAAGSVITKDVSRDALALGRARQENRAGYAKRLRERFAAKKKSKKKE